MTQFHAPAEAPTATPVAQKQADVSSEKDTTTTLVATYKDATGHPYSANYFEVTNIWDRADHGYQDELNAIDSYLQDQVKAGKLDNSTKSALKFMQKAEKKAGVEDGESTHLRIIKTLAYIRMRMEIDEAMKKHGER